MQNRVPGAGLAGRVKLIEEGTTLPKYYYMSMADEPTVAGTPLNKANLLTDATDAVVHGSTNEANHTVNTAFNELGSARVRPHDGKFYTFFPDTNHPYIEFSEHLGADAKSHIVITKDYYVYQITANGSNNIQFKIISKANTSTVTTFTLSGTTITVDSIKSDPNENIVEIRYTQPEDNHSVFYFDASNPVTHEHEDHYSLYGESTNLVMIYQKTIGANRYFWTMQNQYSPDDQDYRLSIVQWKVTASAFTNVAEGVIPWNNVTKAYGSGRMTYDDTYFYYFADNYISLDDEDQNQSYKVFRWTINGLSDRRAFRVFNGDSRWTYDENLQWSPLWIEADSEQVFYVRRKTGSQTATYNLYSAVIDEANNKITFTRLSSTDLTYATTYAGHLDATHILFTGTSGSGASARAYTRIVTISSSTTIGSIKASAVVADSDSQNSPLLSTTSRTKHTLGLTPFVAGGLIGAVTLNEAHTSATFYPIYQSHDISGSWVTCSIFEIVHTIDNAEAVSWVISGPANFTVFTESEDKSDIRYLPGYFREGRV